MEKYYIGIDEAGRGAFVGPMVVTGVLINERCNSVFKEIGIKDSKLLSSKKRLFFYDLICDECLSFCSFIVWPNVIDANVKTGSLNVLESKLMSEIINSLVLGSNLFCEVFIDSPETPDKFSNKIQKQLLTNQCNINCSFKADTKYVCVSAASVVAKVIRDLKILELNDYFGNFGSGYPSDKNTIEFFKKNLEHKEFLNYVRKSWSTYSEPTLF